MKKVFQYELFSSTEDDQIPECTEQERWAKKDVFAVKKEGRKTAVKLFDTQEEAEAKIAELGKGHYLEIRKGESINIYIPSMRMRNLLFDWMKMNLQYQHKKAS